MEHKAQRCGCPANVPVALALPFGSKHVRERTCLSGAAIGVVCVQPSDWLERLRGAWLPSSRCLSKSSHERDSVQPDSSALAAQGLDFSAKTSGNGSQPKIPSASSRPVSHPTPSKRADYTPRAPDDP